MKHLVPWRKSTDVDTFFDSIFESVHTTFDDMFEHMFEGLRPHRSSFGTALISKFGYPRIDILDNSDHTLVRASVPGVDKKDLNIKFVHGILEISGKAKENKGYEKEDYIYKEIKGSAFTREVGKFDPEVYDLTPEKIGKSFENGILELRIPKKKKQKKQDDEGVKIEL